MRVLTFLHSFEPGGVERIAMRLVRRWRETGVDAPLFVGRAEGAMLDDVGRGLDYVLPPVRLLADERCETLWMMMTLPAAVRELKPDVIFCPGNTYAVVAAMLKLYLGLECPPIVAKVSNDLDRRDKGLVSLASYRLWLRGKGRFLDRIVAMSQPAAGEIVERMAVPAERVSVIPDPALSEAAIARLRASPAGSPLPGGGRRFVAVGRLARQKNLRLLLRAFHRGASARDQLTLIGEGPERPRLERTAGELGLGDRVVFRGYSADAAGELHRHDVLLLSSDYEGVPAVVLEALAAGLPVVATNCSRSMPMLLADGLGTLVPVGDVDALSAAIAAAVPARCDPRLSLRRCRDFTIEAAARRYIELMGESAAGYVRMREVLARRASFGNWPGNPGD